MCPSRPDEVPHDRPSPVAALDCPRPHSVAADAFTDWLDGQLADLEWRFRDFSTRSSFRGWLKSGRK